MTPNQTDDVIAGYRKATDAHQQIIQELRAEVARLQAGGCARDQSTTQFCAEAVEMRDEISILREQIESRDRHMNVCRGRTKCPADEVLAEWLKGFVRFDDPVVTGLVDVLVLVESHGRNHGSDPLTGEACGCESCENYFAINKALSAYEARVKEVAEPVTTDHDYMKIPYGEGGVP